MSDYTEHLISMAGGDGEPLDQIERRITDCQSYKFGMRNADKLAHEDAPYLLALVREQQARIGRSHVIVSEYMVDYSDGIEIHYADLARLRAALTATDKP